MSVNKENTYIAEPFIVWTMRRTGGTSLMKLLQDLSSCKKVQHEPFNKKRVYGRILRKFKAGKDVEEDLIAIFKEKQTIKHCYEIMPMELNELIHQVSSSSGYKHIFLYRKNQVSRMLSLGISNSTKVWGSKQALKYEKYIEGKVPPPELDIDMLVKQYDNDMEKSSKVYNMLEDNFCVEFEELYFNQPSIQLSIIERTLDFLGFDDKYDVYVMNKIFKSLYTTRTPSVKIKDLIPNYEEAESKIHALDDVLELSSKLWLKS